MGHPVAPLPLLLPPAGMWKGMRINIISETRQRHLYPAFRNINGDKREYLRGFGYQGGGGREGYITMVAEYNIGKGVQGGVTQPGEGR